jgi:hypothetical protein
MTAKRYARRQSPRSAEIQLLGPGIISIRAEPFEAVADQPLYSDMLHSESDSGVTLRIFQKDYLGDPSAPHLVLPIGLLERLQAMLDKAGWRTTVFPARQQLGPCVQHRSGNADTDYTELLRRVLSRSCALAEVASFEHRLRIIAALRKRCAEMHVLIVVKNKAESKLVAGILSTLIGSRASWGIGDRNTHPWTHVDSVGTFTGRSVRDWALVIFLDAELTLSQTAMSQLMAMGGSARFGFSTKDVRQLPEIERAMIESVFGPIVYQISDEHAGTLVAVDWLTGLSYPSTATANQLQQKRDSLWRNDSRNGLIAQVAQALGSLDHPALETHGLFEATTWLGQASGQTNPSVAIVVENAEHGRALARHLPGWPLRTELAKEDVGHTPMLDGNCIVTVRRALRCLLVTNVVVYAVGTGERWLDELGPPCEWWSGGRMLVIDIEDDADPEIARQVQSRRDDYQYRGWQLLPACTGKGGQSSGGGPVNR